MLALRTEALKPGAWAVSGSKIANSKDWKSWALRACPGRILRRVRSFSRIPDHASSPPDGVNYYSQTTHFSDLSARAEKALSPGASFCLALLCPSGPMGVEWPGIGGGLFFVGLTGLYLSVCTLHVQLLLFSKVV